MSILVNSFSPCLNIEAFVEQDDNTCYFYLWYEPNLENQKMKSCFICNKVSKDKAISYEQWKNSDISGPPAMPYEYVSHSDQGISLSPEDLEIVWTVEGSGAGVFCKGELLCFIPEWANEDFCGFSKYVKGQTPYGVEITSAMDNILDQLKKGKAFWATLEGDFWRDIQESQLKSVEDYFGNIDNYYAIDGGKFPPKALVTKKTDKLLYGITIGVSVLKQPMVEKFYGDDKDDFARIELGFACTKEYESIFMPTLSQLAGSTDIPWKYITSLGHGHTVKCSAIDNYAAIWLLNSNLLPNNNFPRYEMVFGERVNLLWAIPLTQEEYDFLLEYDMSKIFNITFAPDIHIFDGTKKVPLTTLKIIS